MQMSIGLTLVKVIYDTVFVVKVENGIGFSITTPLILARDHYKLPGIREF